MERRCGFGANPSRWRMCAALHVDRQQHLDGVAEHLLAVVAEQAFHLAVDEQHLAIGVDDDHAVGHGLDHFEQPVFFFHRGSTVPSSHARMVGEMFRGRIEVRHDVRIDTVAQSTSGSGQFGSPPHVPPPPNCAAAGHVVVNGGAGQSRPARVKVGDRIEARSPSGSASWRWCRSIRQAGAVRPSQPSASWTTARRSSAGGATVLQLHRGPVARPNATAGRSTVFVAVERCR